MTDLITLECFKEYKGIKSTPKDGKLQSLISMISELVEHYCNRRFTSFESIANAKVEGFDAKTNIVYLTEFPVITVLNVFTSVDGGRTQLEIFEGTSPNVSGGYFADLENGTVATQRTVDKFLTQYDTPYRSLEVIYRAGYTEETLPEDLKLTVMDLIDYYESEQRHPSKSLAGATIDNPQPYLANSFPPHIRRVLDLYRFSP